MRVVRATIRKWGGVDLAGVCARPDGPPFKKRTRGLFSAGPSTMSQFVSQLVSVSRYQSDGFTSQSESRQSDDFTSQLESSQSDDFTSQ